jgi:hypothetical protein
MSVLLISVLMLATVPSNPASTKSELLDIERRIGHANLTCDYDYFRKIEAEEFFFTGPTGQVTTREQDLAGEKDCKKHNGTFSLREERVLLYGNTAVVSAIGTYETTKADGSQASRSSRFTDVFVRRKGQWLVVAGHSSNLKEATK